MRIKDMNPTQLGEHISWASGGSLAEKLADLVIWLKDRPDCGRYAHIEAFEALLAEEGWKHR